MLEAILFVVLGVVAYFVCKEGCRMRQDWNKWNRGICPYTQKAWEFHGEAAEGTIYQSGDYSITIKYNFVTNYKD